MKKLSIIVPVYNVEQYIKRCIQSLVNQDVSPDMYDIIVVDDGSPDNSIKILEESFRNSNIIILHKENGGLSSARNYGLDYANSEYVWFVDSDDWIEENCLSNLFEQLNGLDVLAFSNFIPEGRESRKSVKLSVTRECNAPHELLKKYKHTEAQLYIYRTAFLKDNDLFFYNGIYHEDVEFNPRMLYKASSLRIYEKNLYHFFANTNSISTVFKPKRCYDYIKLINSLIHFKDTHLNADERFIFDHSIAEAILTLLLLSREADDVVCHDIDTFLLQRKLRTCLLHSIRLNTRILGFISLILYKFPLRKIYNSLYGLRYA